MMEGEPLVDLVKDVAAHGVKEPTRYHNTPEYGHWFIDGRNRLEAAEQAGIPFDQVPAVTITEGNPIDYIVSLNAHRRHLSKKQRVRFIDDALRAEAAAEKPDRVCAVSESASVNVEALTGDLEAADAKHRGGRGKINEHKARLTDLAKAQGISPSTVRDVLAEDKPKGKKPKTKPKRRTKNEIRADNATWTLTICAQQILQAAENLNLESFDVVSKKDRNRALEHLQEALPKIKAAIAGLNPKAPPAPDGLDAAREHYAAEFTKLPLNDRNTETDRLIQTLRDAS
jgi:hypothetical protein